MLLAIETATSACSVALIEDRKIIALRHEVLDRGHAECLIPMIAELPNGGRADRIIAGCGPGSFTGIRVGLAAARGLAIAWQVEAFGYSTLALIAAGYFAAHKDAESVFVTNEAGHGEVFVEGFSREPFASVQPLASVRPEAVASRLNGQRLVGSAAERLAARAMGARATNLGPDVRNLIHLPPAFLGQAARPLYGRGPDAKLPS
jgi:tRNA threonylcarbamoyladenosine biosynthesis protein TsaB